MLGHLFFIACMTQAYFCGAREINSKTKEDRKVEIAFLGVAPWVKERDREGRVSLTGSIPLFAIQYSEFNVDAG